MKTLLDTHTSILNMTENIQEITISEANSVINNTINLLHNETVAHNLNSEIQWMSPQLLITMIEFKKLQDAIVDSNHKGKRGINSLWISFDKLYNQISLISGHLSNGTMFYGETIGDQMAAIYKLSKTRMLLTEQTIIFVFEIPLF